LSPEKRFSVRIWELFIRSAVSLSLAEVFFMSFELNGMKKEATEVEALYKLVKFAFTKLNMNLKNLVGKAFDRATNVNGLDTQGTLKRNEDPLLPVLYFTRPLSQTCAQPRLQDTMTQIELLRNVLDSTQALYNFLYRRESQMTHPV